MRWRDILWPWGALREARAETGNLTLEAELLTRRMDRFRYERDTLRVELEREKALRSEWQARAESAERDFVKFGRAAVDKIERLSADLTAERSENLLRGLAGCESGPKAP